MAESQHLHNLRRALRMDKGDTLFQFTEKLPRGMRDHILFESAEKYMPPNLIMDLVALLKRVRKTLLLIVPLSAQPTEPYLLPEDNVDADRILKWPLQQWLHFIQNNVPTNPDFIVTGSWHYPGLRPASSQVPKSTGFIQFTRI